MRINKKITTEEFIKKARKIHGDKYDYSKTEYVNHKTKIIITCKKHGDFKQTPVIHISRKSDCRLCGIEKNTKNRSLTTEKFISQASKIHKNNYNYKLSEYVNAHTEVLIICNNCKTVFNQTPNNHIRGKNGCPNCYGNFVSTTDEFILKAKNIHPYKDYDYSLVNYKNSGTKIKIICKKDGHGIFEQNPSNHISKTHPQGCPICKSPQGEIKIINFLSKNKINYIRQKRFNDCRYLYPLPFDFYIPDLNICIEFDGMQHFVPVKKFGGIERLKETKLRDTIKNNYCVNNKIKLIRIKYTENVEKKLNKLL